MSKRLGKLRNRVFVVRVHDSAIEDCDSGCIVDIFGTLKPANLFASKLAENEAHFTYTVTEYEVGP